MQLKYINLFTFDQVTSSKNPRGSCDVIFKNVNYVNNFNFDATF